MQGNDEHRRESYRAYDEQGAESATPQTTDKNSKNGRIRFGLTTIKNFGEGIAEAIIAERKRDGAFTSLSNFLTRIHDRNLNKKSLEALIMAGAFDSLGDRGTMHANIDLLLSFNKEHVAGKEAAQDSLFGSIMTENIVGLIPAPPLPPLTLLNWEKELLGVYVSGHPLDAHQTELAKRPSIGSLLKAVHEKNEIAIVRLKGELVTAGMVSASRELITKKGDKMAFVTLADAHDQIEMVVFPKTYAELKPLFVVGSCIAVKGKLTIRNDEPSIALDRAKLLSGEVPLPITSESPE